MFGKEKKTEGLSLKIKQWVLLDMEKRQLSISGHEVILVASGVNVPLLARRDQLLLKDKKFTNKSRYSC